MAKCSDNNCLSFIDSEQGMETDQEFSVSEDEYIDENDEEYKEFEDDIEVQDILMQMEKNSSTDEARCYQAELLEMAKERNLIICLPTGSGKTYIALQLAKFYLSTAIRQTKYIVFLATTVPLVNQQAKYFRKNIYDTLTPEKEDGVRPFTGDMNVDAWSREKWLTELKNQQILVMTPQIFLDILNYAYISFFQVVLLILDECHHAGKDHPMSKIMDSYRNYKSQLPGDAILKLPRVLGLTATIIRGVGNISKIETNVTEVESIMCAKAITYHDYEKVLKYSTNARLEYITYSDSETDHNNSHSEWLLKPLQDCIDIMSCLGEEEFNIKRDDIPNGGHLYTKHVHPTKEFCKSLEVVIEVYKELGLYCSRLAACMKKAFLATSIKGESQLLLSNRLLAVTALTHFLSRVDRILGNEDKCFQINRISPKMEALRKLILEFKPDKNDTDKEKLCAVVFVQKRIMTQVLSWYFQDISKYGGERFKYILSAFVIGSTTGSSQSDIQEARVNAAKQLQVVEWFHKKKYNLVFATSVLEEGLDVPSCSLVVRFDAILSYPSFVQSMGRARKRNARFCVLTEVRENEIKNANCKRFESYNLALSEYLRNNALHVDEDDNLNDYLSNDALPPFCPGGTITSPMITISAAISIVNEYCGLQSTDRFVSKHPISWWVEVPQLTGLPLFKAYVKFPQNSVVQALIEGPPMKDKTLAKRAAHLEACKELYKNGGLNEHLLPIRPPLPTAVIEFLECLNRRNKTQENRINNGWYEKMMPNFIRNHTIRAGQLFDVYVIHLTLTTKLSLPVKSFYDFDEKSYRYGLILPENIGTFGGFGLEGKFGPMNVHFEKINLKDRNKDGFSLEELCVMISFHRILFEKLLALRLSCAYSTESSPLFVVPLNKGKYDMDYKIAWDVIQKASLIDRCTFNASPTDSELKNWKFENNYDDTIVVPWYIKETVKLYIVQSVRHDCNINSDLEKNSNKGSLKDHYKKLYDISVQVENQPLLQCKEVGTQLNFLSVKHQKSKHKGNLSSKDSNSVLLVPEFVKIHPFPGSLYVQAKFIPSILHRVCRLLVAENIKLDVATYFGWKAAMESESTTSLELEEGEISEELSIESVTNVGSHHTHTKPNVVTHNCKNNILISRNGCSTSENISHYGNEEVILEYIHPEEITNEDIKRIRAFKKNQNATALLKDLDGLGESLRELNLSDIDEYQDTVKNLDLQTDLNHKGPSAYVIMEALTVSNALDAISLERLETMGDSFLKYCVSVQTYCDFPRLDEGVLTEIRSKLICNKYLLTLGNTKMIGEYLSGSIFVPLDTWVPPGYTVPPGICKVAVDLNHTTDAFSNIPRVKLEGMSTEDLKEFLSTKGHFNDSPLNTNYEYTKLPDKRIADSVEALIGAYFTNGGCSSALRFMDWIGMRAPTPNGEKKYGTWDIPIPFHRKITDQAQSAAHDFIPLIKRLENIIEYKFKDPWLLVEAFTHPSYTSNSITGCYQRLEFLGDAVLDFLVTCHIYHMPRKGGKPPLTPGELTDLRSALVNNVTFGSLAVRYGLHKYLLSMSKDLQDSINVFVANQETQHHKVSRDFTLLNGFKVPIARDVDVPKVLGDLFESLCGAVFLDCKMKLDITWKIFYRLLKNEIDLFSENVPLSAIRELHEKYPKKVEIKSLAEALSKKFPRYKGTIIQIKVGDKTFYGCGVNKASAKQAAAKLALANLTSHKKNSMKMVIKLSQNEIAASRRRNEDLWDPKSSFKFLPTSKENT